MCSDFIQIADHEWLRRDRVVTVDTRDLNEGMLYLITSERRLGDVIDFTFGVRPPYIDSVLAALGIERKE